VGEQVVFPFCFSFLFLPKRKPRRVAMKKLDKVSLGLVGIRLNRYMIPLEVA